MSRAGVRGGNETVTRSTSSTSRYSNGTKGASRTSLASLGWRWQAVDDRRRIIERSEARRLCRSTAGAVYVIMVIRPYCASSGSMVECSDRSSCFEAAAHRVVGCRCSVDPPSAHSWGAIIAIGSSWCWSDRARSCAPNEFASCDQVVLGRARAQKHRRRYRQNQN